MNFATHYWIVTIGDHPIGIVEANARTFFSFGRLAQFSVPFPASAVLLIMALFIALILMLSLFVRSIHRTGS
jgi:hypothetical protein